jgi:hypothetical protein
VLVCLTRNHSDPLFLPSFLLAKAGTAEEREAHLKASIGKSKGLHRVGGAEAAMKVDIDENTLVDSLDDDLDVIRKEMHDFKEYVEADEQGSQMSEELKSLMRHMHGYATRYNVDLYRSFKEGGGKQSWHGGGNMSKVKFQSILLTAFGRMSSMFKPHLLEEITTLYGTGPTESGQVLNLKKAARCVRAQRSASAQRICPMAPCPSCPLFETFVPIAPV